MLSCIGLGKSYSTPRGTVEAVKDIDLEIRTGEFAAIIGRSGSGKSSLMAMMGGLSRPTKGSLSVNGQNIWALSDNQLAEFRNQQIGFVFQCASLLTSLRLIDNVALPALLSKRADKLASYQRAAELLSQLGLSGHLDAYPLETSAGEQRRAAIARALINSPALLLADEPTSDLDLATEFEIMERLRHLNHLHSTTLVLVTHSPALAQQADRALHIADGRLIS